MNLKECLSYDDVLLVPKYSGIESRSEIDLSTDLGKGLKLTLPIISAPMDTISEHRMARAMAIAGGVAIVHRYNPIDEQVRQILAGQVRPVGAAIGVTDDYLERATAAIVDGGATFLCVDVAHGHHILVKKALEQLRAKVGDDVHIMAGNVATLEGIDDLAAWGVDSARCNIGGGSICSTRLQTGHGIPGLQTIIECARTDKEIKIIADGGIKNSGDMVKALAAGADAVMIGSLLAGTQETPGDLFKDSNGFEWKSYRGMASKEAQMDWRGQYSSYEGVATRVPYQGPVASTLADLEKGIRSGFSYSGARSLQELWIHAEFVTQTSAGIAESKTHIDKRTR